MNWNNCQYFINQNQCKNKKDKNGVCKEHCYKQFRGEYFLHAYQKVTFIQ